MTSFPDSPKDWQREHQVALALEVLRGQLSVEAASEKAKVDASQVQAWVEDFLEAGASALLSTNGNGHPHASPRMLLRGFSDLSPLGTFIEHIGDGVWCAALHPPVSVHAPPEEQADALLAAKITLCNERFARWSGVESAAALIGLTIEELSMRLQDAPTHTQIRSQALGFVQNQYRYQTSPMLKTMRDGQTRWIVDVAYGSIEDECLVCFWRHQSDVSEYIRRQQAIAESEAHLRSYIQHSKDAIWCLDLAREHTNPLDRILNGRLTIANSALLHLLGLPDTPESLDALREQPAFAVLPNLIGEPTTDTPTLRAFLRKFIDSQYQSIAREYQTILPNSAPRWTLHSIYAVVEDNTPLRLWGNITDTTSNRLAIQERDRIEATMRRAERLESLGQLAGGVAHDFNNLLMAILGYVDLAEVDIQNPDSVRDSLAEIRRAGYRAAELTRELLTFSRRQSIHRQPTDLNDLILNLSRMLRRLLHEHIDLDIIPGHHIGAVSVDPSQIEQVILNLCANARDAMLSGGRLTIETQNVLINGEYRRAHPWARPGRYVLLTISDTGCGIPPEHIHRIFEPFFTTKPPGQGTGLGLSTVYGIVKQHDGMVNVYSEPGVGSTFKVYLPIVEQRAARTGQPIQGRVPGGKECILVAEDEPQVREILKKILTRVGYDVIITSDGREALDTFRADPHRVDLILLDMVMPGLGGLEVQARVREIAPHKPIIFSSGYAGVVLDSSFFKHPENVLLTKPYDPDRLLTLVRQTLDRVGKQSQP